MSEACIFRGAAIEQRASTVSAFQLQSQLWFQGHPLRVKFFWTCGPRDLSRKGTRGR